LSLLSGAIRAAVPMFFLCTPPSPPEISTLSLHDALPICSFEAIEHAVEGDGQPSHVVAAVGCDVDTSAEVGFADRLRGTPDLSQWCEDTARNEPGDHTSDDQRGGAGERDDADDLGGLRLVRREGLDDDQRRSRTVALDTDRNRRIDDGVPVDLRLVFLGSGRRGSLADNVALLVQTRRHRPARSVLHPTVDDLEKAFVLFGYSVVQVGVDEALGVVEVLSGVWVYATCGEFVELHDLVFELCLCVRSGTVVQELVDHEEVQSQGYRDDEHEPCQYPAARTRCGYSSRSRHVTV